MIIQTRARARVGLVGNPSDMYYGKTIACTITNFAADISLWESPAIELVANPAHDWTEFGSLRELSDRTRVVGYYGGTRLLYAACRRFHDYCRERGIALGGRNFTISYDTTIPRQVGLGGSSAIITATIRALMEFYEVDPVASVPLVELPNLVLSVETRELGLAAGLQDRVVQAYGGTMYMDFDRSLMGARGYGEYVRLDSGALPALFLAYLTEGTESGKVHTDVRQRFEAGDPEVASAMEQFAMYAADARHAIESLDHVRLGALFNQNFDLRRKVFGDHVIGPAGLEMVRIARELGCPAKFSGSQGAVVGICASPDVVPRLRAAYEALGYAFAEIVVGNADDS